MERFCNSCRSRTMVIRGSTSFKCPKCGEAEIVRCAHCREIAAKYRCPKCRFEGPN